MELLITSIEQSKLANMSAILTENGIESDFSSDTLTIGDPFTTKPIYQYHLYVDTKNLELANKLLIDSKIFEGELTEDESIDYSESNFQEDEQGRDIGTLDDFDLPNFANEKYATRAKTYLIVIGYGIALLGGFISVAVGGRLYFMKISVDHGGEVYAYDEYTRKHGLNMIIIGSFMFVGGILIQFIIK
jgi:hypothetical protein